MIEFYWSFNESDELWRNSGDTIEECIAEAKEMASEDEEMEELDEGAIKSVFIGELYKHVAFIDGGNLVDSQQERAYENCGESAEGWLNGISKEKYEELSDRMTKEFNKWLKEVGEEPSFGIIENIKEFHLATGLEINR